MRNIGHEVSQFSVSAVRNRDFPRGCRRRCRHVCCHVAVMMLSCAVMRLTDSLHTPPCLLRAGTRSRAMHAMRAHDSPGISRSEVRASSRTSVRLICVQGHGSNRQAPGANVSACRFVSTYSRTGRSHRCCAAVGMHTVPFPRTRSHPLLRLQNQPCCSIPFRLVFVFRRSSPRVAHCHASCLATTSPASWRPTGSRLAHAAAIGRRRCVRRGPRRLPVPRRRRRGRATPSGRGGRCSGRPGSRRGSGGGT